MANKIQFKRGVKANLPTLSVAEPAFTTDTNQFFIGNGTNNIELAKAIDLSDIMQDRIYYCGTTSGTNTYTATNSKITAYTDGLTVRIKIGTASTGASTLNINGFGAKTILDTLGNAITSGGLKAGLPYQLCYNGTNFIVLGKGGGGDATAAQILLGKKATVDSGQIVGTLDLTNLVTGNIKSGVTINGVSGKASVVDTSDALATAAQILSGASAYVGGIKITGTMPDLGNSQVAFDTWTDYAGTLVYRVPSIGAFTSVVNGYKPEVIKYDANFVAANIISGKSIFGVAGSATISSMSGKRYVSGSIAITNNTAGAGVISPALTNGNASVYLGFRPTDGIFRHVDSANVYGQRFATKSDEQSYNNTNWAFISGSFKSSIGTYEFVTINDTGFTLSTLTNGTVYYEIFG